MLRIADCSRLAKSFGGYYKPSSANNSQHAKQETNKVLTKCYKTRNQMVVQLMKHDELMPWSAQRRKHFQQLPFSPHLHHIKATTIGIHKVIRYMIVSRIQAASFSFCYTDAKKQTWCHVEILGR
jgi:hypothetical protein